MRRNHLAWMIGVLMAGCVSKPPARWNQPSTTVATPGAIGLPSTIVTPELSNTGRITSVNPTARFVVITYPVGIPLPELERRLGAYRAGLKVGEIKITGPSRDLNTVADIIAGECRVGDEIRGD